jgi:hypothetical protein
MFAQAWQTKSFKTGPFQKQACKTAFKTDLRRLARDTFRSNGTFWNRIRLCSAFLQRVFQGPAAPVTEGGRASF